MKKRTLILTERQLKEIASGINIAYLDKEGIKPDMGDVYSTEVSAEGSAGKGESYSDEMTTDDFAIMQSKDWPRDSRSFGRSGNAPANIREMSKKDWENRYIFNEEQEHGNKDLNNRIFGDGDKQYSYGAIKQKEYRERNAAKKAINGSTPEEKAKGLNSLKKIQGNDGKSYATAKKQFEPAKMASKLKPKKIASAPKETGNGKAHSVKNGFITPIVNN